MRTILLQCFIATVCAAPVFAQVPPGAPLPQGQTVINLSATEHGHVEQDLLIASLSIEKQGNNPRTLQNQINTIMQQAVAKAKAVSGVQVSTGQYYIYPVDQELYPVPQSDGTVRKAMKARFWRGSQSLELRSTQSDALLPLAGDLQDIGLGMQNLSYSVSPEKEESARDALMESALTKLKAKAERAARALDKSQAELTEVSVDSAYLQPPPMRPMAMGMAAGMAKAEMAAPVAQAGVSDIDLTVTARAILKP